MKTPKSPENEEVTPSKKKLKQARLPFKIISDVSPKADVLPSRKRKLSAPEPAPVTKIGKITKENVVTEVPVVISDDDSKDGLQGPKEDIPMNPYVKLVNAARKKKQQQKSRSLKKKKGNKKSVSDKCSVDSVGNPSETAEKDTGSLESMEVDSEEVEEPTNVSKSIQKLTKVQEKSEKIGDTMKHLDEVLNLDGSDEEPEQTTQDKSQDIQTNLANIDGGDSIEKDKLVEEDSNSDSEVSYTTKESDIRTEPISMTPRRSTNENKEMSKLNISQVSTGDESMSSNPSTPRRSMRSSTTSKNQGDDVSLNESNTNSTPKQLQKKIESAKKKEEREKEKQERDKKRQQEKEERAKQKQEKEEQRKREKEEKEEARKKEKEEKEEMKRKEREEKERQKELEKKIREEKEEQKRKEKEEKDEQRKKEKEAKEEEKRKKQEALELEKLEQEQKKKKAAEAFVNFFVPKQKFEKEQTSSGTVSKSSLLSSFTIKSDMRLAPTVRVNLTEENRQALDNVLKTQNVPQSSLYVKSLKAGVNKPLSSEKTWPLEDKDDDVMIIEDELPMDGAGEILTCDSTVREKLRPKLFSFHENRRPPYWGTWRKKSTYINPRRPFQQDQKHLDYEVDSDEDWEEEQEGESIDGSAAGSDDEQDADEYEVDNEVFVPHGYLSDEEATMDDDDVLSLSPETQKARLKHLEDEFELELKKPTEKLKPRLYGLLWETSDGSKPENCVDALWNYFGKLAMIMNDPTPLLQPSSEVEEGEKKKVKKKKSLPDQHSPKNEKKKTKQDSKESKKLNSDPKKNTPDVKKNQPGINTFLTKIKS